MPQQVTLVALASSQVRCAQFEADERCHDAPRDGGERNRLSPAPLSDQFVSSNNKLANLANSWEVLLGKLAVKIQQLHLQILEILTLRPMIGIYVQIPQKLAIGFTPVGERLGARNRCNFARYPCMLST